MRLDGEQGENMTAMRKYLPRPFLAGAAMLAAVFAPPDPARADALADFYKGKTVTLFVGAGTGGSYDMYARLLAPHLSKHLPGNPTVVVKLILGGGGGLPAAIHMQRTAPRDGTAIGLTQQTIVVAQLIEPVAQGKYDVNTWGWIGLMAPIRNMLSVWHTAPAQTLEEAKQKEVIVGANGRTSPTTIVPQVLNEIAGTRFKIVQGYNGISGLNLALERGEIQGRGASWLSVVTATPHYITEKKLKPLVFDGLSKEPGFPDVPLLIELARTDQERQALHLMAASAEFGRAIFTTPGVPADRLAALRRAFDAAVRDPELLAEAKKRKMPIEPQTGEAMQKVAASVTGANPEAIAYARKLQSGK
jgi:tripartite-type tricarboxylate transporter receptor subunit TctC